MSVWSVVRVTDAVCRVVCVKMTLNVCCGLSSVFIGFNRNEEMKAIEVLPILKEKVAFLSGESAHNMPHTSHKCKSNARSNSDDATVIRGREPGEEIWVPFTTFSLSFFFHSLMYVKEGS